MSILNKIIKKEDKPEGKGAAKKEAKKKAAAPKPKTAAVKASGKGETPVHYFEIIKRPYISEKAFALNVDSQYVFLVSGGANKTEIKKAIEKAYKVTVKSVNITNAKSKPKRYHGVENIRSGFKKAVITLHKGSTIDVMEGAK